MQGHLRLINVASQIIKNAPETMFLFAGEGELFNDIKQEVYNWNLDDFFLFPGFVEKREYIYGATDIVVVPSDYEGLSHTILEGMSLGIPAIATNCGGVTELINDGVTGFICPKENMGKFVSSLIVQ